MVHVSCGILHEACANPRNSLLLSVSVVPVRKHILVSPITFGGPFIKTQK